MKLKVTHTQFVLIFTTLLYVVYNALNIEKISKWFYLSDGLDYSALTAYLLAGLCLSIIVFTLLAHRFTTKFFAIVFVALSATSSYFIAKYNVAIDTSMILNVVYTDQTEAGSLLTTNMLPWIAGLVVLPALLILATDIRFQSPGRHLLAMGKTLALALLVCILALYLDYNSIMRAGNVSKKYIVHSLVPINFIRSIGSASAAAIEPILEKNKEPVKITGQVTRQDDLVVVLAIGESSRQKNFTLYGYDRKQTNPVLSKVPDLHALNGIARLGSTLYALPEILEKKDVKLPRITSEMGIETACYVNYSLYDNCTAVGQISPTDCAHDGTCYDEDVIPMLAKNLENYQSGYRFVVLHMGGGSHGPVYRDRHPPEFEIFQPACTDADIIKSCTVDEIYNSYDNTILYVDHVMGSAIETLDKSGVPYVFLYVSDHGESLLEEGRIFHGMPPGIPLPPEQAQVPLLVKSSVPVSITQRDEYPQPDIYDTVLDLFSIETDLFDKAGSFIKKQNDAQAH